MNYLCEVTFVDLVRMLPSVRFVPGVVVSVCIYPED